MINYPIDITDKNPTTFTFSPAELNITPVTTSSAITIPLITEYYLSEGELLPIGTQKSIWIGSSATADIIMADGSSTTWRHEIQSLAFEDGRTNLKSNINFLYVDPEWTSAEEAAAKAIDPDWDDRYFDPNNNFFYLNRTAADAGTPSVSHSAEWNDFITITKSLRLPEGVSSFGQFTFGHTHFDKQDSSDYDFHNPTDFRIMIPSTVTTFSIMGYLKDYYSGPYYGIDETWTASDRQTWSQQHSTLPALDNLLYFFRQNNITFEPIWRGDISNLPNEESTKSEIDSYLANNDHDTIHIYLRNHTTVPTINFIGAFYFPIVFHVNAAIEEEFKDRYANTIMWDPYAPDDSYSEPLNYDALTIVADYGSTPEVTTSSLKDVTFAPSAVSGSFNDLVNKPSITEVPDPPTTDGNYTLSVTVSSGEPTYTWVAAQS